jgi:hypothetical protein
LAFVASVDFCALQVVERDLATESRVFVYTQEEMSFQRRCLNMVLDLLASPDARVRQVPPRTRAHPLSSCLECC